MRARFTSTKADKRAFPRLARSPRLVSVAPTPKSEIMSAVWRPGITPACSCQALEMFGIDVMRLAVVRLQLKPQPLGKLPDSQ
jgi:hypothetical protein